MKEKGKKKSQILTCKTHQLEFAGSEGRRGSVKDSPACNVTEVLTLQLHHPVASELRHCSELRGINTASSSQELRRVGTSGQPTISLQTSRQQQPPLLPRSPPSSLFEQKAIRTCGRPWSGPPAKRFTEDTWYPIWWLFRRMGRRKNKVVRHLEF